MKELLACIILCMMFANCNNPEKALSQKQTIFNENQLIVTLYTHDSIVASESKIQITTRFYNSGEQEIKLEQSSILENPILSLIITNEKGNTIPTIPPLSFHHHFIAKHPAWVASSRMPSRQWAGVCGFHLDVAHQGFG